MTTNTRKIMISFAVVGAAAAVAGMGTFGTFTSTTSGSETVGTGTVAIALGGAGGVNDLSISAAKVVPGDTIQRALSVANTGTADFGSVTLTTAASPSSILDTDATNGLKLQVDACSAAWTKAGTAAEPTYTCSGTTTTAVASRPVIGTGSVALPTALTAGRTDNLRVVLSLPTTADNTFQGKTSTINLTFDATQRTAATR